LPGAFFDSSAVAKLYHEEAGTKTVEARVVLLRLTGDGAYISRLVVLEVQSVFAKKVRSGELSKADAQLVRDRFLRDIQVRSPWRVAALHPRHFQAAEVLIQIHGDTYAIRTLDALQLAVALDLRDRGFSDTFVSADRSLCNLAAVVGLQVMNPEGA